MKILLGCVYLSIAYIMVWFQLFGALKFNWLKENNWWFMYVASLPIAYFITNGSQITYYELQNSTWSVRFISFVINTVIFGILTYILNNEGINLKTATSLFFCFIILGIQIFWK